MSQPLIYNPILNPNLDHQYCSSEPEPINTCSQTDINMKNFVKEKKNDEIKRIIAEKDAEIKKKFNEKYIQI